MLDQNRKAFTMLELTFVIVIIGILSSIAIPKFSATRDDAIITKARVTISSLRNAISTERQLRVLRGDFTPIISLDGTTNAQQYGKTIFDFFDNNDTTSRVLEYPMRTCATSTSRGCWIKTGEPIGLYEFRMPHNAKNVDFNLTNNRLVCKTGSGITQADCDLLVR